MMGSTDWTFSGNVLEAKPAEVKEIRRGAFVILFSFGSRVNGYTNLLLSK